MFKPVAFPSENSQSYIYRTLKQNIIALCLKPGTGISETELTAAFNMSRSPVRGALSRLQVEGLVVIEPQRRTSVAKIDAEYTRQASFTRNLIETELAGEVIRNGDEKRLCRELSGALETAEELFARKGTTLDEESFYELLNADRQFHGAIYTAANRAKLLECMQMPYLHYTRFQSLHLRRQITDDSFISHHQELIDLIRARDIAAIHARSESNIEHAKQVLQREIALNPDYFC